MSVMRNGLIAVSLVGAGLFLLPASGAAQKKDRNVISREEIELAPQKTSDIYQLIRAIRPHFLAPPRGVRSMGMSGVSAAGRGQSMETRSGSAEAPKPIVYVNGMKGGELESLKLISAIDVREVRYYEPSKAEGEFGPGHDGGVVAVVMMNAPEKPTPPKP